MTIVTLFATLDLESSLDKVVGLLFAIVVFYAVVEWSVRRHSALPMAVLVVGLGAGTALLSLLGTQWDVKWSFLRGISSLLPNLIGGLPGAEFGFNPNTVSGTLITFIPLQICILWWLLSPSRKTHTTRHLWLASGIALSLLVTVSIVLLAQSRGAWVALVLGLLLTTGILLNRFRIAFAVVLLAAVVLLIVVGPVGISDWLVQQQLATGTVEASWAARVERWSRWLWAIADFPLTGPGMDVFRKLGTQMYPFFHALVGEDLGHAHNAYLHTALDLGIPGLISYLALLGATLVTGWQCFRRARHRLTQLVALGGVMGLATHALWSFVDVLPLGARTNFLWWTVAALVMTIVIRDDWGKEPEPDRDGLAATNDPDGQETA